MVVAVVLWLSRFVGLILLYRIEYLLLRVVLLPVVLSLKLRHVNILPMILLVVENWGSLLSFELIELISAALVIL